MAVKRRPNHPATSGPIFGPHVAVEWRSNSYLVKQWSNSSQTAVKWRSNGGHKWRSNNGQITRPRVGQYLAHTWRSNGGQIHIAVSWWLNNGQTAVKRRSYGGQMAVTNGGQIMVKSPGHEWENIWPTRCRQMAANLKWWSNGGQTMVKLR